MIKKSCNNKYLGDLGLKYDPKSIIFCTAIPCLGVEKGDNLQKVLESMCDSYISNVSINENILTFTGENEAFSGNITLPSPCDCPLGTYTINSVCSVGTLGQGNTDCLTFNVTPNFTQTTPTFIDVAIVNEDGKYITPTYKQVLNTITEDSAFTFSMCFQSNDLYTQGGGDSEFIEVQLIDNNGNYSEQVQILLSNISDCS